MRSRLMLALSVGAAPLLALTILPSGGQPGHSPITPTLEQASWPFFAKNCTVCHNAKTMAGGLDLQAVKQPGHDRHHPQPR